MGMREVQSITHDEVQVWVSELAGLQVGDVDFERQRIHVLRTVSEIRDYFVVGTPKTGETRTVIFPSLLRPCLEGACKGRQSSDLLFPDKAHRLVSSACAGTLPWRLVLPCEARRL